MEKILKVLLIIWSILLGLSGLFTWFQTMGQVVSTEFNLLIAILNKISILLVWIALFSFWLLFKNKNNNKDNK